MLFQELLPKRLSREMISAGLTTWAALHQQLCASRNKIWNCSFGISCYLWKNPQIHLMQITFRLSRAPFSVHHGPVLHHIWRRDDWFITLLSISPSIKRSCGRKSLIQLLGSLILNFYMRVSVPKFKRSAIPWCSLMIVKKNVTKCTQHDARFTSETAAYSRGAVKEGTLCNRLSFPFDNPFQRKHRVMQLRLEAAGQLHAWQSHL